MNPKLLNYLKKYNIDYKLYAHPAVHTVEESKKIKQVPGMHCKSLFLKDDKENFYLIGMKADKKLDTKKLKSHLEVKKLNFASPKELKEQLNITPGSVSIFNLISAQNIFLIIDEEVWNSDLSGFHPNINTETLVLDKENLKKYYNSLNLKKEVIKL